LISAEISWFEIPKNEFGSGTDLGFVVKTRRSGGCNEVPAQKKLLSGCSFGMLRENRRQEKHRRKIA